MKTYSKKSDVNYKEISTNHKICASCIHWELVTQEPRFKIRNPDHFCFILGGMYVGSTSTCDLFEQRT